MSAHMNWFARRADERWCLQLEKEVPPLAGTAGSGIGLVAKALWLAGESLLLSPF